MKHSEGVGREAVTAAVTIDKSGDRRSDYMEGGVSEAPLLRYNYVARSLSILLDNINPHNHENYFNFIKNLSIEIGIKRNY